MSIKSKMTFEMLFMTKKHLYSKCHFFLFVYLARGTTMFKSSLFLYVCVHNYVFLSMCLLCDTVKLLSSSIWSIWCLANHFVFVQLALVSLLFMSCKAIQYCYLCNICFNKGMNLNRKMGQQGIYMYILIFLLTVVVFK